MADENESQEESISTRTMAHVRSEKYVSFYSNFAQCAITPWDIRIVFGEIGEIDPDAPAIADLASVILTPQIAVALVRVLNGNITAYEQQYGKIQMPSGMPTSETKHVPEYESEATEPPKPSKRAKRRSK